MNSFDRVRSHRKSGTHGNDQDIRLCLVELRSWGFDDNEWIGYLRVNGLLVVNYTRNRDTWTSDVRGINTNLLRPETCEAYDSRTFDTYDSPSASDELVKYINSLETGTIICGLTFDEAAYSLSDSARSALLTIGVDVRQVDYRGKLTFVATIGQPQSTMCKVAPRYGDNLLMNATVGTSSALLQSTTQRQKTETALHLAARDGNEADVNKLIHSNKTMLTTTNKLEWLPLHFAVEHNHANIVRLLVNAMNDEHLNSRCSYKLTSESTEITWTSLHIAVYRRHVACLENLNHPIVNPENPDERGYSPVHLATDMIIDGDNILATLLRVFPKLKNEKLDVQTADGLTPLMLSVMRGNHISFEMLIKNGADITASSNVRSSKGQNGQNVLHVIVRKYAEEPNNAEQYRQIYRIIAGDDDKRTAASTEKLKKMIRQKGKCSLKPHIEREMMTVVEFGAAVGAKDLIVDMINPLRKGNTDEYADILVDCLHAAAKYGQTDVIKFIIGELQSNEVLSSHLNDTRQFPLKFEYEGNWTALHVAVHQGHIECIKELSCLNPLIPDDRGYLPVHLAADLRSGNVLKVFLETFSHKSDEQLERFHSHGFSPLMMSALLGNVDGVRQLVEYGVDVEKTVPQPRDDFERNVFDEYAGQNVVHLIVKMSVDEPSNVANFLQVYDIITQSYIEKKRIHTLNNNLLQRKGNCCYPERFQNQSMTAMQYAAAVGAADLLGAMVDSLLINDIENIDTKYCDVALDYLIPSRTELKSCSELISSYCTLGEMVKMERIEPLTQFAGKFACLRTIAFTVLLLVHITHMVFLTNLTISTGDFAGGNSSDDVSGGYSKNMMYKYLVFLVWPSALLVYEVLCALLFVFHLLHRCVTQHSPAAGLRELRSMLNSTIGSQFRIIYLGVTAHVSAVVFAALMFAWYFIGIPHANEYAFNARRNISLSATVLVWGWMMTLEYIRFPAKIHTFVAILKLIFIKDIFYITFIYAFVLVGFAAAIFVYLLTDVTESNPLQDMTFLDCVYHVYTTMLGDGELFENKAITASNSHRIRSVFAVYLCLSIIVLLNMLIAMMNNRYANVLDIRRSLWFIETINSIAWFASIVPFKCGSCLCVFERLSKKIKKPVRVEPAEDSLKILCSRIDAIEANLEEIRNKLENKSDRAV